MSMNDVSFVERLIEEQAGLVNSSMDKEQEGEALEDLDTLLWWYEQLTNQKHYLSGGEGGLACEVVYSGYIVRKLDCRPVGVLESVVRPAYQNTTRNPHGIEVLR